MRASLSRFLQTTNASYLISLLKAIWLLSTCARHGRARVVNTTKRSGSTCFVCKMVRLRNIGTRMIELDAINARHRQRWLILFSLDRQSRIPGIF